MDLYQVNQEVLLRLQIMFKLLAVLVIPKLSKLTIHLILQYKMHTLLVLLHH